jgi:heme exporter protein C
MRQKLIFLFAAIAVCLLAWDLYRIAYTVPDEVNGVPYYKNMFFHVPFGILSLAGFGVAMAASIGYLWRKDLRYDAVAVAVTEVSLVFATILLVTGSIWAHVAWNTWWNWEPRLTTMLICWILYAGYLMLRRAIDEPHQRARLSGVLSIFAFVDVVIVWKSIEWWKQNFHPDPVLKIRGGKGMDPGVEAPMWWNLLALALIGAIVVLLRLRQENMRREIESLRRYAHAL